MTKHKDPRRLTLAQTSVLETHPASAKVIGWVDGVGPILRRKDGKKIVVFKDGVLFPYTPKSVVK